MSTTKQRPADQDQDQFLLYAGVSVLLVGVCLHSFSAFNSFLAVAAQLVEWNEYFGGAKFQILLPFLPSLPAVTLSVLDFAGSLMACRMYRISLAKNKISKKWSETLVSCTLIQFGGTTLTGFVLGQAPSWTIGNHVYASFLVAWWLTFFSPYDLYWKLTEHKVSDLYWFLVGFVGSISRGHAVCAWGVDKAMYNDLQVNSAAIQQSVLLCILCGALSGSGGGIFNDFFALCTTGSFTMKKSPRLFQINNYVTSAGLNRSFLLATLYYLLTSKNSCISSHVSLSKEAGRTVIGVAQVLNFIIQTINPDLDLFSDFGSMLLWVLHIKKETHS